jgi:H+/gluconate symporter-like permease
VIWLGLIVGFMVGVSVCIAGMAAWMWRRISAEEEQIRQALHELHQWLDVIPETPDRDTAR